MATARQTITLALRKLRVIGRGGTPSSAQITDHLSDLNAMLAELVENDTSWPLVNVRTSTSYTVPVTYPGVRVQCMAGGLTITAPEGEGANVVPDGMRIAIVDASNTFDSSNATFARNGWKLEGSAANLTLSTEALSRMWMFRADLGDWKRVADITIDQDLPYPAEFDSGMGLLLARKLEGEYGQPLGAADNRSATRARIRLQARYMRPAPVTFDTGASYLGGSTGIAEEDVRDLFA